MGAEPTVIVPPVAASTSSSPMIEPSSGSNAGLAGFFSRARRCRMWATARFGVGPERSPSRQCRGRPPRAAGVRRHALVLVLATTASFSARAAPGGEADVVAAQLERSGDATFRLDVTVRHADEGWDHYADNFDVVAPDGRVLGTRTLLHPHVDEQPFTRSLTGLEIPDGIDEVVVRAHDSVHGNGGADLRVRVPR